MKSMRRGERGNVLTVLLAAVGLAGMLGVVTYNLMSGPLATLSRTSTKGVTDGELLSAARLLIMDAATLSGADQDCGDGACDVPDCDGDGFIEPRGWTTSATNKPAGGGIVPSTIGIPSADAWGSPIGYCVWNIGTPVLATRTSTCGQNGANRLRGSSSIATDQTVAQTVLAVISAGPNRVFNTTCSDYTNGTTSVITPAAGSDDIVHSYSYAEASQATSAIWKLKAGDPATGQLMSGKNANIGSNIALDQGAGAGNFAALSAGGRVTAGGGAKIGVPATCGGSEAGLIRYAAGTGGTGLPGHAQSRTPASCTASAASIALAFTNAQTVGNMNIVVVNWASDAGTISSIVDTKANTYTLIGALTRCAGCSTSYGATGASQAVYYAKNIAAATAGSNTVTVTFSGSVTAPDIAILEYSGADKGGPLDVSAVATGTSAALNSGPATTTYAKDMLIGAGYVGGGTVGVAGGYASRIAMSCGGIVEEKTVTAIGANSAQATNSVADKGWIMNLAAIKGATASLEYCDGSAWQSISAGSGGSGGSGGGGKWTRAGNDIYYNSGAVNIGSLTLTSTALVNVVGSDPMTSIRNISDCGDSCGGTLNLYRARGTVLAPAATSTDDVIGLLSFKGYGSAYTTSSELRVKASAASGSAYTPAKAEFNVQNDQGTLKTAATLTPIGLGFGIAAPTENLHAVSGFDNPPTVTMVQKIAATQVKNNSGAGGTSVAAMPSNVAAGNVMIVVVGACRASGASAVGNVTVTDSQGNSYAAGQGGVTQSAAGNARAFIFRAVIGSSAANTITVTNPSATTYLRWGAYEVSGLDTTALLDKSGIAALTSANAAVSTSGGATAASAFAVAATANCSNDAAINYAAGASWTQDYVEQVGTSGVGMSGVSRTLIASSNPLTHTWTNDAAITGGGYTARGGQAIATFKGQSYIVPSNANVLASDMHNAAPSSSNDINFKRGGNTVSVVQATSVISDANANTSSGSFSGLPQAGNSIIVTLEGQRAAGNNFSMPGSNAVYDNQGNAYSLVAAGPYTNNNTAGAKPYIYVAHNIGTPSGTFTVTVDPTEAAGNNLKWGALEVAGLKASPVFDATGTRTYSSTGPYGCSTMSVSASGPTTQAQEFAVGALALNTADANSNIARESTWSQQFLDNASTSGSLSVVSRHLSSIATPSHAWTYDAMAGGCTANEGASAVLATFKAKTTGTDALPNGSNLGTISFNAYDGNSTETVAQIKGIVNGAVTTTSLPADLSFQVGDATANLREAMRIDSRGYVGLNRTPDVRLDIDAGAFLNFDAGVTQDGNGLSGLGRRIMYDNGVGTFVGGEINNATWASQWNAGTLEANGFGYGTNISTPGGGLFGGDRLIIGKNMLGTEDSSVLIGEGFLGSNNHTRAIGKGNTSPGSDYGTTEIGNNVSSNGYYSASIGYNIPSAGCYVGEFRYYVGSNMTTDCPASVNNNFVIGLKSAGSTTLAAQSHVFAVLDGKWGIGTATPSHILDLAGDAEDDNSSVWANASDIRLKDILGPYRKGLDDVAKLETIRFNYKKDNPLNYDSSAAQIGFIAQQVAPVFPEAVSRREDGYLDFNMHSISIATVNALKELDTANRDIRTANDRLRQDNEKTKASLATLEARLADLKEKRSFFERLHQSSWSGLWFLPLAAGAFFFRGRRKRP